MKELNCGLKHRKLTQQIVAEISQPWENIEIFYKVGMSFRTPNVIRNLSTYHNLKFIVCKMKKKKTLLKAT